MKFRIIGALVAAIALGAFAAAGASAEEHLWVLLPGSAHETFQGSSGKFAWQVKGSGRVVCTTSELLLVNKELEVASELLEEGSVDGMATLALGALRLTGCAVDGFAFNSLGNKAGVILMLLHIHTCMIAPGRFGWLIEPLAVHLELPATGILTLIRGAFVAAIKEESSAKDALVIEQTEGKQAIARCEGGEEVKLEFKEGGGEFTQAAFEAEKGVIEWDKAIDKEGETLMENSTEANLWVLLPGSPHETFKGSSSKTTLQVKGGGPSVTCKKSELLLTDKELSASSELLEEDSINGMATLALGVLHFTGCTTGGLSTSSLGDKSAIILVHLHMHLCKIGAGRFGLLIKPLPVHLEVPSTGLLIAIEGSVMAEIAEESVAKDKLTITQKEGKQTIEKCESGEAATLWTSVDGGTPTESGLESKEAVIEWDKTIDKSGETLMES